MANRVRVAIIGGGPAGLLLARRLQLAGHEVVVVEHRTRAHVKARIRAGVIEWGTVELLRAAGVGTRMDEAGFVHDGVGLSFAGRRLRIDFRHLVDRAVMIYGQTEITADLYTALDAAGVRIVDAAADVAVHDVTSPRPSVTYTIDGVQQRIDCDYVAGCDGAHSVTRDLIPAGVRRDHARVYPFAWLGVLSATPPVDDELIYAHSARGFALCSMRNPMLSRYYVQCDPDDTPADWSDDRFWSELTARLPADTAARLITGPSIEKSVTPLRSRVTEPLRYGRLFLAGDAGHLVPPTGAKGLNLAMSDVHYLATALDDALASGRTTGIDEYSDRALARVWKATRFSWWMTTLMHRFDADASADTGDFGARLQEAELAYLATSTAAQRAMAENYTGLPL